VLHRRKRKGERRKGKGEYIERGRKGKQWRIVPWLLA